jgi:hypothetical protein
VVYDFEKASTDEELYGQTLDIPISNGIQESSIYLAFDNGRIAVVTVSKYVSSHFCLFFNGFPKGSGVFILEVDESSLGNISNEAPILSFCRVFRLRSHEALEEVSCLMMSDTGLYLNWIHSTLIADGDDEDEEEEDDEEFEVTSEDDTVVGKWGYLF